MSDDNIQDDNAGVVQDGVSDKAKDDKGANDNSHSESKESEGKTSVDTKQQNGFSADYVKKIREEAVAHRTKAQAERDKAKELEKKLDEAQKVIDNLGKSALEKATKLNTVIEKRLINAELQKLANQHGLIDMDAFKMVDLSSVELSQETGEIIGLEKIVEDLKSKKAYLFKSASTANPNAKPPVDMKTEKDRIVYKDAKELKEATEKYLASL